jgi:molybdopterin converting factor small subunit
MHKAEKKQELKEEEKQDDQQQQILIDVKLFAYCRELIGKDKITLKLKNQVAIDDIRKKILELYPVLSQGIQFAIALNYEIVNETTAVKQKDEVAILPPVNGG